MGKAIGIVSLKGGVGKTSTVVSLGAALAEFGKKVLLVDANFSAPNLGLHLNIVDPEKSLFDVIDRSANFKDAIYDVNNLFHVLPAHLFNNKKINPFDLKKMLKTIKNKYDVILIDSSPSLNEETMAAMLASDELLVVTTPDYVTLATTIKAVEDAKNSGVNVKGLILNKVRNKSFELSLKEIEEAAGVPVLAVIPDDVNVLRAQAEFLPATIHKPNSKRSIEFKKLAACMTGEKYNEFHFNDLFNWVSPPQQAINREVYYKRVFK